MRLPALPSTDLGAASLALVGTALGLGLVSLVLEVRRHSRRVRLLVSGVVAALATAAALVRPRVSTLADAARRPPLTVIVDDTRSLALPFDTRADERAKAIASIGSIADGYPVRWLALRGSSLEPFDPASRDALSTRAASTSLADALRDLRQRHDAEPQSIIVVSDGRDAGSSSAGAAVHDLAAWRTQLPFPGVPVHTVALGKRVPDASIASVRVVGSAFAHGPMTIRVEVLCQGLECDDVEVEWRPIAEAEESSAPHTKAVVHAGGGRGEVELTLVYDRPGRHAATVALVAPAGDSLAANNERTVLVDVRRERVRMLHVAGRPTNDVRALRRFLKANPSLDLISFFILRTQDDDPRAAPSELSLIPFPVDELFEEHLPSFDAVVLQDIDAEEYGLARHLRRLSRYVEGGGGLVLVGGPHAFAAGGYDRSSLANVLPTELEAPRPGLQAAFEPRAAAGAESHPILEAFVRGGGVMRILEGTSALGAPLPGSRVVWEHPSATTRAGKPMPVLAIRDVHAGRTVALGTDGTWRIGFSEEAATTSGGAYDALWDAIIGWTLHDARFDAPAILAPDGCTTGEPLRVATPVGGVDRAEETLSPTNREALTVRPAADAIYLPALSAGVHDLVLAHGDRVTARGRIVCELAGDEWVDVRPDHPALKLLAEASGGHAYASASDLDDRVLPTRMLPTSSRHERPLAPTWLLALLASVALGAHWFERRRFGLR